MMRRVLAIAILAGGCSSYDEPPEERSTMKRVETPSTAHLPQLVADNAAFAADLYRYAAGTGGNLLMSPHSITTALAMTYAGAANNTATEIATALHFTLPPAELHEAMNALDLALDSRVLAANSLFAQVDEPLQPAFLDTLAVNY